MKTITTETKVFTFDELSEKAKEVARHHAREIDLSDEWWANVYEDAASIGLKITSFDLGRGRDIDGELERSAPDVIVRILSDHGPECDTRKLAVRYQARLAAMVLGETDELDELQSDGNASSFSCEFVNELLGCYWKMLDREHDYLNSDEQVDESIRINDRDYEEDGTPA